MMIKSVVVLVISTVLCQASVVKEACITPRNEEGLCINLRDCTLINTMSNDFDTPMTVERLNYLIESMCGYANQSPKVCCPIEEVTMMNSGATTDPDMIDMQTTVPNREEATSSNEV